MVSLLKINNKKDNEQATDEECYGFDESEPPFRAIAAQSKSQQPSVSKEIVPFKPQSPHIELIKNAVEPFMQSRAKTHNLIYYEHTTFKELGTCNFDFIQKLLDSKSTDGISRDGWKTLCWLNTKPNSDNLSFKTFKIDGELVKLFGSKGNVAGETEFANYASKVTRFPKESKLIKFNSTKVSSLSELKNLVVVNRDSSIENILSRKRKYRLTQPQSNTVVKQKPGPLQSKLKKFPPHPYMEPPEIFEMPDILLEVFPAVNKPLDNDIKCYLKYIQPSDSITREWAEFSVSTLVEKFKKQGDKTSFEFCIPYVNDQKHVLVRRRKRLQESGKDERAFKELENAVDYEFMKEDMVDECMKDCANVLEDMFESVSLGLSENLFIQNDPDVNYNAEDGYFENKIIQETETLIASKKKGRKGGKCNSKLMNELRKLNATIVNADDLDLDGMKKCENLFCSLGCVCESLRGQLTQTHCGLTKCMLEKECSCKRNFLPTSNAQSEFISEDDVIKIREQTTRTLAPVEKDFTSTVVIKNNETLLINESQFNRKRRSTRCQKRYNDDLFYDELNPDRQAVDPPPAPEPKPPPPPAKESELEKNRKVFVYEDTYQKIKDLSIVVPRFKFLDNIVPWCIYHNSYKCNCKNNMNLRSKRSLDNKGVEEKAVVSEKASEKIEKTSEKIEKTPPSKRKGLMTNDFPEKKFKKDEAASEIPKEVTEVKDVKETKTVLAQKSQRYMSRKEPPQSQGFVSVEISDSDMEISDKDDEEDQLASSHHKRYVVFNTKKNDHSMRTYGVQRNPYYIGPVASLAEPPVPASNTKPPEDDECMIVEKKDEVITIPDDDEDTNESNGVELVPDPPAPIPAPVLEIPPVVEQIPPVVEQPPSIEKALYTDGKTSITKMNSLVTKKVMELQKAQSMKVDNIVNPGVGKILISTYANLLSWLIDGKVHIWKIETEADDGYFVVTTYKAMPVIDNVIGIMNIKAERNRESLPAIFQLLLSEALSTKLNRLSVVLFGNSHYWTIRGFSYFEKNLTSVNAVKVLPETHPVLSKKIEKLHNIIIDQEIRIRNDIQKTNPNISLPAFQPVTANQSPSPHSILSPQQTPTIFKQVSPTQIIPPPQMTTTVLSPKPVDITQSLIRPKPPLETTRHAKLPKMDIPQLFATKESMPRDPASVPKSPSNSEKPKPTQNPPPGYMEKETDHFAQSQAYKHMTQSNIMHRQVTSEELSKIHLPVFKDYDHRWYIIDFKDDFTYMYIPETDEFLSHHRLQKSAAQSNYKNKVVQLSMRKRSYFNCFVTPPSMSYLYMGPFSGNTKPPIVLLLSLVNGKVIPRQENTNPYGSVTTSFIISVGENGIDCPGVPVSSPINKERTVRDEVRLVPPPTPIQPKVFKNLFDTSSKTTNIGHITIQKLSVQAGGVASISIPQAVVDPPTSAGAPAIDPVTHTLFPQPPQQQHNQLQQQNSNSFLRKCLSAAPKPITQTNVKNTVTQLSNISGLKISQVKSLREEEANASAGLTPKPIFNTYSKKQYNSTTPTKSNVNSSSDDNTEYGYYIADHDTAPKVFAKKTEEAITLKTPAVEESASRIVRVKMESAVIRFLNEFIFKNFKLSPTNWRFLKINKKDAKDLLSLNKSSRAANST